MNKLQRKAQISQISNEKVANIILFDSQRKLITKIYGPPLFPMGFQILSLSSLFHLEMKII